MLTLLLALTLFPRYPTELACRPGVYGEAAYECDARAELLRSWDRVPSRDAARCVDAVGRTYPTYTQLRACLQRRYTF